MLPSELLLQLKYGKPVTTLVAINEYLEMHGRNYTQYRSWVWLLLCVVAPFYWLHDDSSEWCQKSDDTVLGGFQSQPGERVHTSSKVMATLPTICFHGPN